MEAASHSTAKRNNVIVTGASKGIGRAIASIFASHGHSLFICSRSEATLYKTMEELLLQFPESVIKAKPADLSKKDEAIGFGNWCLSHGVPDILVNNAGLFEPGSIHNEPDGVMESQLATNLLSAYHLTRTVIQPMMKQKSGHIFNICSIAALHAYENGGAYSVSKFAMNGFNKNLREEMKPYQVKVTALHPGAVMTETWGDFDNSTKRIMEAEDIAKLVYASSELSFAACVEEIIVRPLAGDL